MKSLDQSIDEKFLEKNSRIENAFNGAGIKTYQDLFEKSMKSNIFNIPLLGVGSMDLINRHIIGKFGKSLPNYQKSKKEFLFTASSNSYNSL